MGDGLRAEEMLNKVSQLRKEVDLLKAKELQRRLADVATCDALQKISDSLKEAGNKSRQVAILDRIILTIRAPHATSIKDEVEEAMDKNGNGAVVAASESGTSNVVVAAAGNGVAAVAVANIPSAAATWVKASILAGPFMSPPPLPHFRVNSFCAINQKYKVKLVLDMSSPKKGQVLER